MAYNNLRRCLNESICPVCGKIFYKSSPREWAYKYFSKRANAIRYTCSYSCNKKAKGGK